jgi:hypothetical protein
MHGRAWNSVVRVLRFLEHVEQRTSANLSAHKSCEQQPALSLCN